MVTAAIVAVAGLSVVDAAAAERQVRLAGAIDATCKSWIKPAESYEPDRGRHEEYAFFFGQYSQTYGRLKEGMHATVAHTAGSQL